MSVPLEEKKCLVVPKQGSLVSARPEPQLRNLPGHLCLSGTSYHPTPRHIAYCLREK